jgi:hypothetical protein
MAKPKRNLHQAIKPPRRSIFACPASGLISISMKAPLGGLHRTMMVA